MIVTSFQHLLYLSREEYKAKKSGNIQEYEHAKKLHQEYKELCLKADKMDIGMTFGAL